MNWTPKKNHDFREKKKEKEKNLKQIMPNLSAKWYTILYWILNFLKS